MERSEPLDTPVDPENAQEGGNKRQSIADLSDLPDSRSSRPPVRHPGNLALADAGALWAGSPAEVVAPLIQL